MQGQARVGVTGVGLICPLGDDVEHAWRRLMAGDSSVQSSSWPGIPELPVAPAQFDPASVLSKLQQVGVDRVSAMALGAARRALSDAGFSSWRDSERVGLYVGTGLGGAGTMDSSYAALHEGRRLPPLTVPAGMVNGAAAVTAIHAGIRGPVLTYAVACASSAVAIAEAAHALRRGEVDVAIAGGAEALLVPGTIAAWHALRTLASARPGNVGRSCRPFAPDRNGLVLGEGAAFLVLEREHDLLDRAHMPRAWLAGSAIRCDAQHLTNPSAPGQAATLRAALRASGMNPVDIGYCNAHGTATLAGDKSECEALREIWQEAGPRLRVSSTKAAHGHLLGAAGALEAFWTVLAVQHGEVPPTGGVDELDATCQGLNHVLGRGIADPQLRHAISNSFAFGGTNASLVFSAP